jgi:hypothetical protein
MEPTVRRRTTAALCTASFLLAMGTPLAAQEEKKSGPPTFKSVWKMDLPASTKRVAVADVMEDKLPRLLVLNAEGTLAIQKLSAEGSKEEASVALGAEAGRFVAGHFSKSGPAQIVVPTAVFYREGGTFRKKALSGLEELRGSVRFKDGTESLFLFTREMPPTTHELDLAAEKTVKEGREFPQPTAEGSDFREIVPHFDPDMFENAPFPEEVKKGSLARLLVPRADGRLYGLLSWQAADGSHVVTIGGSDLFPEPNADMKPLWKSPKLAGKVLDIALGPDPKGGAATGILVLTEAGDGGKGRQVEFFAIEP